MVKITRYLDPEPAGGSGSFMGGAFDNFGTPVAKPAEGGAGAGTGTQAPAASSTAAPTAPDPAQVEKDQAAYDALSTKDEASLTAEEKAQLAELRGKYDFQELDADGKPITAEDKKKAEETKKRVEEILKKPEGQRTVEEVKFLDDNTPKEVNIYEEVDKLSGLSLDVDYGDTTPNTPEWIAKREEAIRDVAIKAYDAELKAKYPLGYQFLLHQQAGGDAEAFFSKNPQSFKDVVLSKDDKSTQESIYRRALALKGLGTEQIDISVQAAKDKGKLFDFAQSELTVLQRNQAAEEAKLEATKVANEKKDKELSQGFFTQLDSFLNKGVSGLVIPKEERAEFADFLTKNTFVQDGKLIYYKELDVKSLEEEVAANYFKFKKGDLTKLVERKAQSANTDKLRKAIKTKLVPKTSANAVPKFVPMKDV